MSDGESALDFRQGMIRRRLKHVKRLLLVLSGKGGVGKSVISATLAALLADSGYKVGLMDADLYGPSSALLFDVHDHPTEGQRGLVPPASRGVKIMSVDLFAEGRPVPLTGQGATQVLLELFALTEWGELDYLIVDMPPATGDVMLTLTSLGARQTSAIVVTMPDRLSTTVAHRVLDLLQSGRVPIAGVLGNMVGRSSSSAIAKEGPRKLAEEFHVPLVGLLHRDPGVAKAVDMGDIRGLAATEFANELRESAGSFLNGYKLSAASRRTGRR